MTNTTRKHCKLSSQTGDDFDYSIFLLLNAVLSPTGIAIERNSKKRWRFSIADSQNYFISSSESILNWASILEKLEKTLYEYKLHMQPIIFRIIGEENIKYIVKYFDIYYEFENIVCAVSTCFKLHYGFNLQYHSYISHYKNFIKLESSFAILLLLHNLPISPQFLIILYQ